MLCWGSTKHGQLGLGGIEEEVIVSPCFNKFFTNKKVKQVACGVNHSLFLLDDGTVYSCGNNDCEQLGHDGPRKRPEQIVALEAQYITQIGAGHSYSVALNKQGQLFVWGSISGSADNENSGFFFPKPRLIEKQILKAKLRDET
jgi:E3 ubiquitin-protein ligase HERC4